MNRPKQKIAGVILAAGTASRMKSIKQLLPFGKTTLLGRVISNARKSALDEIVVVLGHRADKIQQAMDFSGTKIIINHDYPKGQGSSLGAGLEQVSEDCGAVLFLLGDQPLVSPLLINQLVTAFENSHAPIVIPYCNGKRGNPVIIARALFPQLKSLSDDAGARVLFHRYKSSILKVEVADEAVLVDVDTKEDYERLMARKA